MFKALTVKNDWEALSYTVEGDKILPGYHFVQYPDGFAENVEVFGRSRSVPYQDMGHNYTAYYTELFIVHDFHGVEVQIPLEKIKGLKVWSNTE